MGRSGKMNKIQHKLDWYQDDDHLSASHPYYHNDGMPILYKVQFKVQFLNNIMNNNWEVSFEGSFIYEGTLIECLLKCEEDANQDDP